MNIIIARHPSFICIAKVSEETVLGERSGLYLNAGPYLLLYSKGKDPEATVASEKESSLVPPIVATQTWSTDCLVSFKTQ